MLVEIVKQIIDLYLKSGETPTVQDLAIRDEALLTRRGCIFVTIFDKGNIRGSAGNIKELEQDFITELISSTVAAISGDHRFNPLSIIEAEKIQIRVDEIKTREMLDNVSDISKLDPLKNGLIVINKNYDSLGVILPNISPLLINGEDFVPVMEKKLGYKITSGDKIYSITTETLTTY